MNYLQLYNSLCKTTIFVVFLVICAGGFVRMTGSGMGCPDWPKCFGSWIPPTDISDLPINYKEIYSDRGYDTLDFNAFNTWTEYVNRLLGLIAGFFCVSLLLVSCFISDKFLIAINLLLVSLMGFQGWMGAVVVYSVLAPFKITIHMLIALLIVSVLLFLNRITVTTPFSAYHGPNRWIWLALIISIIQIIIGTQVRENVDILMGNLDREYIINALPFVFETHRIVAWLVIAVNIMLVIYYRKWILVYFEIRGIIFALSFLLLTGLLMTYYELQGLFQFVHLISAVILFILQTSILMKKLNFSTVKFP